MSEENNIDDYCAELCMDIINNVDVDSIKPFLLLLEKEIKKILIIDGSISNPDDIDSRVVNEKIKVKDLGDGFIEIEECLLDEEDSNTTDEDSDDEYFPPITPP